MRSSIGQIERGSHSESRDRGDYRDSPSIRLQQERGGLLDESRNLDNKIAELKKRMATT